MHQIFPKSDPYGRHLFLRQGRAEHGEGVALQHAEGHGHYHVVSLDVLIGRGAGHVISFDARIGGGEVQYHCKRGTNGRIVGAISLQKRGRLLLRYHSK